MTYFFLVPSSRLKDDAESGQSRTTLSILGRHLFLANAGHIGEAQFICRSCRAPKPWYGSPKVIVVPPEDSCIVKGRPTSLRLLTMALVGPPTARSMHVVYWKDLLVFLFNSEERG